MIYAPTPDPLTVARRSHAISAARLSRPGAFWGRRIELVGVVTRRCAIETSAQSEGENETHENVELVAVASWERSVASIVVCLTRASCK